MKPTRFPLTSGQFFAFILTMIPATCALAAGGDGPHVDGIDWQGATQAVGTLLLAVLVYFGKKIYEDGQDNKQQLALMAQSHEGLAKSHTELATSMAEMKAAFAVIAADHAALAKKVERRHTTRRKR